MNVRGGLSPLLPRYSRHRPGGDTDNDDGADDTESETGHEETSLLDSVSSTVFEHPTRALTSLSRRPINWGPSGTALFSHSGNWCVVRAGPGVARRAPPGTPYHSDGMIRTRTVMYDATGHATLVTVAVPALASVRPHGPQGSSAGSVAAHSTSGEMITSPSATSGFVLPPAPWSPASYVQAVEAAGATTTPPSDKEATTAFTLPTMLAPSPLAGAAPPLFSEETAKRLLRVERQREAEAQQHFMALLTTYPLLSVLPPRSVLEQRYTDGLEPSTPHHRAPSLSSWSGPVGDPCSRTTTPDEVVVSVGRHCDEPSSLRAMTWGGCRPATMRAAVWRLLCGGYAPPSLARQARELGRKRAQYVDAVRQYWPLPHGRPPHDTRMVATPLVSSLALEATPPEHTLGGSAARHPRLGISGAESAAATSAAYRTSHRLLYYQKRTAEQRREQQLLESLGPAPVSSTVGSGAATPMHRAGSPLAGSSSAASFSPSLDREASTMVPLLVPESLAPSLATHEKAILHQLALDLPRHASAMYHSPRLVSSMARCLFLWSQRHPAVGYVQGMDEVFGVFFTVFLTSAVRQSFCETHQVSPANATTAAAPQSLERFLLSLSRHAGASQLANESEHERALWGTGLEEPTLQAWSRPTLEGVLDGALSDSVLLQVEADCYHCAGRLLSTLQANYTPGLSGITRAAQQLESLVSRAGGAALLTYLADHTGVGLREGCYQWLHCLLARELPLPLLLPLWDTYLAAGDDHVMTVHVCVCAALVLDLEKAIRAAPPELALRVLQQPFAAAFPNFSLAEANAEALVGAAGSVASSSRWGPPLKWLEVLIADAYRLWRQFM